MSLRRPSRIPGRRICSVGFDRSTVLWGIRDTVTGAASSATCAFKSHRPYWIYVLFVSLKILTTPNLLEIKEGVDTTKAIDVLEIKLFFLEKNKNRLLVEGNAV